MRLGAEAGIRTGTLESVAETKPQAGQYSGYACLWEEGLSVNISVRTVARGNHESGKTLTSFWVELLSKKRAHKI